MAPSSFVPALGCRQSYGIFQLILVLLAVSVSSFVPYTFRYHSFLHPSLLLRSSSGVHTDDEWHPRDPAHTTPQLLVGLWDQICMAPSLKYNEPYTVIYPEMTEQIHADPRLLNLLFAHLDSCKDVCDHFGISTTLAPYKPKVGSKIEGFTVKNFKKSGKSNSNDEFEFEYDPYWDDGTDFDALYSGIDDPDLPDDPYPEIVNKVPDNDNDIIELTKDWVSALMSDMGVCPFTKGSETAGLPMGNVHYSVDRSTGFEDLYARYWKEVVRLEQTPEKEQSTTLLICPEFCLDNVELFESFSNTLTQPLTALGIEDLLQLIFFHPQWSFRDGGQRAGDGQAANYARRSPWPMINLLRTHQVRAAQKGIPTGLVYKQNEKTLSQVGVDKLETMLRLRDWTDTAAYKVNRREMDALKIAQDYQTSGKLQKEDTSMAHDSVPASNKVDRDAVEEGNLVNVLAQALEKRLGKAHTDGAILPLTGPETSATAMATDVLLEELESVIATASAAVSPNVAVSPVTASSVPTPPTQGDASQKSATESQSEAKPFIPTADPTEPKRRTSAAAAEPLKPTTQISSPATVVGATSPADIQAPTVKTAWSPGQTVSDAPAVPPVNLDGENVPDEVLRARQAKVKAARDALLGDLAGDERTANARGDAIQEALFGRGGVKERSEDDDDDLFPEGMNPDSFY